MISDFVLESTEREIDERRSSLQTMNDLLASANTVVDLEGIPPAIIISKDLVRSQVKFKDLASLTFRSGRKHPKQKVRKDPEKEDHEQRKTGDKKHRRNHTEREKVLSLFLHRCPLSSLELSVAHFFYCLLYTSDAADERSSVDL